MKRLKMGNLVWNYLVVPRSEIAAYAGSTYERLDGLTESPDTKNRRMFVADDLRGVNWLDTHIHEMLHARLWDLSEECVTDLARDIAHNLHRLGVRAPVLR